ncbi:hypothetical protein ILYODFUR_019475 [Ilyodon furcidens]|uniref:Uncharacterized protein n=1 Tax=Ilyodon furcidens TaxID=33524 RepID=A0ABV0UTE0_9TELE
MHSGPGGSEQQLSLPLPWAGSRPRQKPTFVCGIQCVANRTRVNFSLPSKILVNVTSCVTITMLISKVLRCDPSRCEEHLCSL